jgi:ankyrin repeat protein
MKRTGRKRLTKRQYNRINQAIERDDVRTIQRLLASGFPVDLEYSSNGCAFTTLCEHSSNVGAMKILKALIEAGADVNKSCGGWTPLIAACAGGHCAIVKERKRTNAEAVKLLLAAGADPNVKFNDGDDSRITPLIMAAEGNNLEIVRVLLQAGADPKAVTRKGVSALSAAAERNNRELVRLLTRAGSRENGPALLVPVREGNLALVRRLIRAGADVNRKGAMDMMAPYGTEGLTPLEVAIRARGWERGFVAAVGEKRSRLSVARAAEAKRKTKALLQIIRELVRAGADVNQPASRVDLGGGPLYQAVKAGDMELVKVLLKAAADPNADYVLHSAAGEGFVQIVESLVAAGADVNKRDNKGRTALQAASQSSAMLLEKAMEDVTGKLDSRKLARLEDDWKMRRARVIEILSRFAASSPTI